MAAMKGFLALVVGAALTGGCALNRPPLREGQHEASFRGTMVKKVGAKYLLFLPRGFAKNKSHLWPTILFLHGSGERGDDLSRVKVNGPPKFLDGRPDFPFIVISPQAPDDGHWDPDVLNALLDDAMKRLPIDPDRVYLTGLSMGGYGAYELATDSPERFAAVAPISGAGDPDRACRLKNLPLRAYHGGKDPYVLPADDEATVDAINACGGRAKMTLYPEAGHDVWTLVYADQGLYNWFLLQTRGHPAD
jgi:predicted peptidase